MATLHGVELPEWVATDGVYAMTFELPGDGSRYGCRATDAHGVRVAVGMMHGHAAKRGFWEEGGRLVPIPPEHRVTPGG